MAAVGIDLGTTNSCVAFVKNGKVSTLVNNIGERTTPSVIGLWNEKEIIIGKSAAESEHRYPSSVVRGVKYTIGKQFDDVKNPSSMIVNEDFKLQYCVKRGDQSKNYLPEQLSAMVLKRIKKDAEDNISTNITRAIITVPTYFDDAQREATIAAGKIANFQEVKLLNESVAAAIAYGVENRIQNGNIILVFDFGGGTFDVSILKYNQNEYEVLAIDGDLNLGGDDVDKQLEQYVKDYLGANKIKLKKQTMSRMLQQCEKAKITLTNQSETFIEMYNTDKEIPIDRNKFNELNEYIIGKIMTIVKRCVNKSKLGVKDINDVILVGGSSRIPAIQNCLRKYLKKLPKKDINPDEVVAQGAAIMAAKWNKTGFQDLIIQTITSTSIGVELFTKHMQIVIPKYSKIPVKESYKMKPQFANCRSVHLKIFSGENSDTKNNKQLGSLIINNIAIDPSCGLRIFKAILEIDEDGILKLTTLDTDRNVNQATFFLEKANLKQTEIDLFSYLLDRQNIN